MIFIIAAVAVAGVFLIFAESKRECKKFKITSYFVPVQEKNFNNLSIVMIADLHNGYFSHNYEGMLKSISELAPDMIIIAGDMITCRKNEKSNNIATAEFVNRLRDIAPVYYGMGNHERGVKNLCDKMGDNWGKYVKTLNPQITLLSNRHITVENGNRRVSIYGLDISGEYYKRLCKKKLLVEDINKLLGRPGGDYNILIAHNPDYFSEYEKWGADMVFSGHNHGGLIQLPGLGGLVSPRLKPFPRYYHGLYKKNRSYMVLTNGAGAHSIKIRVNNIPEIVYVRVGLNSA